MAQKLDTNFVELVRFVKDYGIYRWQQLSHTGLADVPVGKKQMVVDHYHVSHHRLTSGPVHMATLKLWALGARAVVARRSDQRNHRRPLVQNRQFGQIAAARNLRPLLHRCQSPQVRWAWQHTAMPGLLQAAQAQVTGTPLQQRHTRWQAQSGQQLGNIATK